MQMIDFKIDIFAKGEGFATHIFSCFGVCITLFLLQSLSKDMGIDNEHDIYFDQIGGLLMAIILVITVGIYLNFIISRYTTEFQYCHISTFPCLIFNYISGYSKWIKLLLKGAKP